MLLIKDQKFEHEHYLGKPFTWTPEKPIEMHFHEYDEVWVILEGKANATLINVQGKKEFVLKAGDILVTGVGEEHGAIPITPTFKMIDFPGTIAEGAKIGHLYRDKEEYIPSFRIVRTPKDR